MMIRDDRTSSDNSSGTRTRCYNVMYFEIIGENTPHAVFALLWVWLN